MKRQRLKMRVMFGVAILIVSMAVIGGYAEETLNVQIDIAPNVLNLMNQGQVVTVHTDLAYGIVDAWTISLNGVVIQTYKSDNQGNFVAKFDIEEIKDLPGLVIDQMNLMVFTGQTKTGVPFTGQSEILVVNKSSRK